MTSNETKLMVKESAPCEHHKNKSKISMNSREIIKHVIDTDYSTEMESNFNFTKALISQKKSHAKHAI